MPSNIGAQECLVVVLGLGCVLVLLIVAVVRLRNPRSGTVHNPDHEPDYGPDLASPPLFDLHWQKEEWQREQAAKWEKHDREFDEKWEREHGGN